MQNFDADLALIYKREIAPEAEALEEKRQKRVKALYRNIGISLGLAVILAGVIYFTDLWQTYPVVLIVAIFLLCGLAFGLITQPAKSHRRDVKDLVIPPICRYLGDVEYSRKAKGQFGLERFREAGVVAAFNRSSLEDLFQGHYRETGYRMVEAKLRSRSGKRSRTVFRGLLFDIMVPQPFSCLVLMVSDKGVFGNKIIGFVREKFDGLEKIEMGHPAFEERYEVYSDDPDEAPKLLVPGFLDTMVALADAAGQDALNAAMVEGRFLLALPHKRDLFEIGKLHRPLDHLEEDLRILMEQVALPHRLIDYLHGERPELLPST